MLRNLVFTLALLLLLIPTALAQNIPFADGNCQADVAAGTFWHPDTTSPAEPEPLTGGTYPVTEFALVNGIGWLRVTDADAGDVWLDTTYWTITLTPDCLFNSDLGVLETADPTIPSITLRYPYGGCLVQSVPADALARENFDADPAIPLGEPPYIVFELARSNDTDFIGIYSATNGEVIYLDVNSFDALRLTPSCLVLSALTAEEELMAQPTVSGTVTYLPRIALPDNAVITVQLLDVSRADAPATVLATQEITSGGAQVPFAFTLPYDPAAITDSNTYAVRAEITIDGELRFTTTSAYNVITRDSPTENIEVIVEQVAR